MDPQHTPRVPDKKRLKLRSERAEQQKMPRSIDGLPLALGRNIEDSAPNLFTEKISDETDG